MLNLLCKFQDICPSDFLPRGRFIQRMFIMLKGFIPRVQGSISLGFATSAKIGKHIERESGCFARVFKNACARRRCEVNRAL